MQCDVTDLQGNHCPEIPEHTVMFDGVETHLCKRCFANVVAGAYGRHLTPRAADEGDSAPPIYVFSVRDLHKKGDSNSPLHR